MYIANLFLLASVALLGAAGCGTAEMSPASPQASLTQVQPGLTSTEIIEVAPLGCRLAAINNAIGESFQVPSASILDRLEIWIEPEPTYETTYKVEIYNSEGYRGPKLATSAPISIGSRSSAQTGWYSFAFSPLTLAAGQAYTFKLVRLSLYSGGFAECPNIYENGIEYWVGFYPTPKYDVSFRLFGSPALGAPTLNVDTAG